MKYLALFLVLLFSLNCSISIAQGEETRKQYSDSLSVFLKTNSYCGNKKLVAMDSIRKMFPFNRTEKIELISFESDSFDPRKIDRSQILESSILDADLKVTLLDLLVNSQMDQEAVTFCYKPRNAILFTDSSGEVISNIMLSLECSTSFDRIHTNFFLGTNCSEKWRLLRFIFAASGVTRGVTDKSGDHKELENSLYSVAQHPAEPTKGLEEFQKWINKNLRYPESAKKKQKEGRVITRFIVERDGSLSHIEVLKGFDPDCDREAIRIMAMSPKWKPGRRSGEAVRQAYVMPVIFKLPLLQSKK